MKEIFDNNFNDILLDANTKYQLKKKKYNESWKEMDIIDLKYRLFAEIKEFENAEDDEEMYNEALDIINVSLMLAKRLNEEKKKNN
jgi:alpha-L-arabinofuranosidase